MATPEYLLRKSYWYFPIVKYLPGSYMYLLIINFFDILCLLLNTWFVQAGALCRYPASVGKIVFPDNVNFLVSYKL